LKPCFDEGVVALDLPHGAIDNKPLIQPLAVLDWKQDAWTDQIEVFIQWEGLFPEDATWENFQDIKTTYPTFDLDGTRNVTDQVEDEAADMDQNEPITQVKNKRVSVRPTKYQDFVIPSLKKGSRK
jgi:hypothetical protein